MGKLRKSNFLSANAQKLLALITGMLSSQDIVFLNHEYISTVTHCCRRQNLRIIDELREALKNELEITYHSSVLIDGKMQRYYYSFSYKKIDNKL